MVFGCDEQTPEFEAEAISRSRWRKLSPLVKAISGFIHLLRASEPLMNFAKGRNFKMQLRLIASALRRGAR